MTTIAAHRAGVLFLFVLTAAGVPAEERQPARSVASVNGQVITAEDLDRAIGNRLMRIRTEEYVLRRAVLDELIAERLLQAEAARRNVSVEELLKTEVESKISTPPAADLDAFYEGTRDRFPGLTRDEALKQIADGMRKQASAKRKYEFIKSLRAAAGVRVEIQPPRAAVQAEGPARGKASAPVTIVEFSDFECPFCSRAAQTIRKITDTYGERVRVVFRDFPLASHRTAPRAAEAAHCADEQGKFWEMHDLLLAKGGVPLSDGDLRKAAADAGAEVDLFNVCLASGRYAEAWKTSQEEGTRAGVTSTPTFFINGRMVIGAAPYEMFQSIIDDELEQAAAKPAAARPSS